MNIFVISNDPKECSIILDDKRLNKMILETAQLLATAIHCYNGSATYKPTHKNHPCSIWTRETKSNYAWLLEYFCILNKEYSFRFNKAHKCFDYFNEYHKGLDLINAGDMTAFANCTPFKDMEIFTAYKHCLNDKWTNDIKPPKWTNRTKPNF